MKPPAPKNAFYAQSGGVTAVINASACGLLETARKYPKHIKKVYAGRHGIIGALTEDMIDTSKESVATLRGLRYTPGGAFGSARYKLAGLDKNRTQYERLIEVFRAHDIGYFFYNGGNDSMDTAHKVSEIGAQLGLPHHLHRRAENGRQRSAHHRLLPRLRLGGQVHRRLHPRGRPRREFHGPHLHEGVRARGHGPACRLDGRRRRPRRLQGGDAPHIILFPEITFDRERFLAKVKQSVEKFGYCVVVVSEGVRDADGKFLAEAGTKDAFGHSQVGRRRAAGRPDDPASLGLQISLGRGRLPAALGAPHRLEGRCRAGLCRRQGGRGVCRQGQERRHADHREKVVQALSLDHWRGALERRGEPRKKVPRHYITKDGFGITAACRQYLAPLIGGEDYPPYSGGLPAYVALKGVGVPKLLKTKFVI
jgi:6-phosphofructokinase